MHSDPVGVTVDLGAAAVADALWDLTLGLAGGACCGATGLGLALGGLLLWGRGVRTLGETRQQ